MKIGIDISQLAYPGTGVATYLQNLVENLVTYDSGNEYILFFASLRGKLPMSRLWKESKSGQIIIDEKYFKAGSSIRIHQVKIPPTILDILWNRLHIFQIEKFIGPVDVFISSDWTQPPSKAKKVTILYDLIVYTYPNETDKKIIDVQKRKLQWVKKEVDRIICISESAKKDAMKILGIEEEKLSVVYPGINSFSS